MGHSRYIGHVGALAVAVGIGTVFTPLAGAAWATTEPGTQTSADADTAGDRTSGTPTGRDSAGDDDVDNDASHDLADNDADVDTPADDDANPSSSNDGARGDDSDDTKPSASAGPRAHRQAIASESAPEVKISAADSGQAGDEVEDPALDVAPVFAVEQKPDAPSAPSPFTTVKALAGPIPAAAQANPAIRTAIIAAPAASPLSQPTLPSDDPLAAPMLWVVAAAARRELGVNNSYSAEATSVSPTSLIVDDLAAALITTAVPNTPPTLTVKSVGKPGLTGKVTGTVTGKDADKDKLTYTATSGAKGTVTITSSGRFTYTPTAEARHAAAAAGAATTDAFNVTVSDGSGGTATVTIEVAVKSLNKAPDARLVSVSGASPITGGVHGVIAGTDKDGDAVSFAAPSTTSKGAIVIRSDGTFTYTPTAAARAAAATSSSARSDSFKVSVSDGHGGVRTVTVKVKIAPVTAPQSQSSGIPRGNVFIDSTGTAFQIVSSLGSTHVKVVTADGRVYSASSLAGSVVGDPDRLVAAPGGGIYLTTYKSGKTTLSLVRPDATVTSSTYSGTAYAPAILAPNGTGYTTIGKFTGARTKFTIVAIHPGGVFTSHTFTGAAEAGAAVGADGSVFMAYQDRRTANVLTIAPNGVVRTLQAAGVQLVDGAAAGSNGVGYFTAATTDTSKKKITHVYRITAAGLSAPMIINSEAVGGVTTAPDGTAYQITTFVGTLPGTSTFVSHVYLSVINASGVVTSAAFNGTLMSGSDDLMVAADGTAYLPLGYSLGTGAAGPLLVGSPNGTVKAVNTGVYFPGVPPGGFVIGPDSKLYIASTSGTVVVSPDGSKVTSSSRGDGVVFTPTGTPIQLHWGSGLSSGTGFTNVATGATSAGLPDSGQSDGGQIVVGAEGTIVVKSYVDDDATGKRTVWVLAGKADGSTVAQFSDVGDVAYLTAARADGNSYVVVGHGATATVKVWRLNSSGASLAATFNGAAVDPATIGNDGRVYVTVLTSSSKTEVRTLAPA